MKHLNDQCMQEMLLLQLKWQIKFLLIRTTTFEKALVGSQLAPIEVVNVTTTSNNLSSSFISQSQNSSERPELTSAR
jgi:hypothetical protein